MTQKDLNNLQIRKGLHMPISKEERAMVQTYGNGIKVAPKALLYCYLYDLIEEGREDTVQVDVSAVLDTLFYLQKDILK